MTTKQDLHRLVDELPDEDLDAARRYLEDLRSSSDPVLRAFMDAPEDDEPLTEDDERAIEEAEAQIRRGETVPWEVVRARLDAEDSGSG